MADILSQEEIEELLDIVDRDDEYKHPANDVLYLLHAEEDCIRTNMIKSEKKANLIKFIRENIEDRNMLDNALLHNLISLFKSELIRRGTYEEGMRFA